MLIDLHDLGLGVLQAHHDRLADAVRPLDPLVQKEEHAAIDERPGFILPGIEHDLFVVAREP